MRSPTATPQYTRLQPWNLSPGIFSPIDTNDTLRCAERRRRSERRHLWVAARNLRGSRPAPLSPISARPPASVFLGFPRPGREPLPPVHPRGCCAGGKSARALGRSGDGGTPRQGTLRRHGRADQCSGSRAFNPDGRIAAGWTAAIMGPSRRRSGLGVSHLSTGLYVALKVCREDRWANASLSRSNGAAAGVPSLYREQGLQQPIRVVRDRIRGGLVGVELSSYQNRPRVFDPNGRGCSRRLTQARCAHHDRR